jgi:hypothetical protein
MRKKKPDIVGNIAQHDWSLEKFSHVLAFEVFEHIPYEEFQKVLLNLHSVTEYIFMSLPINKKTILELDIKIPKLRKMHFNLSINQNKITTENHFWEVGYKKYNENYIENDFFDRGFQVVEKYKRNQLIYYILKPSSG